MFNPIEAKRRFVEAKIQKSFDSGINVTEELELEKAWNIGDEKQYQGQTYYVGGFNAKGQPLWRKKKDGGVSDKKAGASNTDSSQIVIDKMKKTLTSSLSKKKAIEDALKNRAATGSKVKVEAKKYSDMDIKDAENALLKQKVVITKQFKNKDTDDVFTGTIREIKSGTDNKGKPYLFARIIGYQKGGTYTVTQNIRLSKVDNGGYTDSLGWHYKIELPDKKSDSDLDPRDKIAKDAGFKDYEEMKGYQDYVTQKNLLKKPSTKGGMRLLLRQEIIKYEKEHADLIKKMSDKANVKHSDTEQNMNNYSEIKDRINKISSLDIDFGFNDGDSADKIEKVAKLAFKHFGLTNKVKVSKTFTGTKYKFSFYVDGVEVQGYNYYGRDGNMGGANATSCIKDMLSYALKKKYPKWSNKIDNDIEHLKWKYKRN